MRSHTVCAAVAAGALAAQAPQHLVVPASAASSDAPSQCWLPGGATDLRQQVLVGPSHLTALQGRTITALEFRRTAANEVYAGTTLSLNVTLSTAPHAPLAASDEYAANVGADAQLVFAGDTVLPTSPAATSPTVTWTPDNVVHIALQQPFVYHGGTLCVDITGTRPSGQPAVWWLADSAYEDIKGTAVDIGAGCGPFANTQGQWSFASERSLLAGGQAELWAYGPVGGFAIAVLGSPSAQPIPLTALGIGSQGCFAYLGAIDELAFRQFEPLGAPAAPGVGTARLLVPIPGEPWVLGVQAAVQWLELGQLRASNAMLLTVATGLPSLDLAMVDGVPADPKGLLTVHTAHVLRFEYQ